ncbi:MAG: deoxyribodipyrimidine photolyase [Kofleriaceae bacterium]
MRVTVGNTAPVHARGTYVLYWMIAARRTTWSFALDHAIARARELERPLVVFESLRVGYRWANDRLHAFVLAGMRDNERAFAKAGVTYLPYVELVAGEGKGLLTELAKRACLVVTDEQPGFFLPRMVSAAAKHLPVRLELVDGNGLLPLRASDRAFPSAALFRRHLQKTIAPHLAVAPKPTPLARLPSTLRDADIASSITKRWKFSTDVDLRTLVIDHAVAPAPIVGGSSAARRTLDDFIETKLARYGDGHNHPDDDAASGLSPWLHFGHVSAHEVAARVWADARWDPSRVAGAKVTGSREGWWGLPSSHESFLDELVTWRELGYSFCFHRADYDRFSSLPEWAQKTLRDHASDPRPVTYTSKQLEAAATDDPVWNAAQRQLVHEGRIHNYLRMLWGKKILEWSPTPQDALATLVDLNNRYAIDGRDPNSYSGIFWTLGRFDRPWAPIRPIFGAIRYMSSTNTVKKLHIAKYLARWSAQPRLL